METTRARQYKVLFIDDNLFEIEVYIETLREKGYVVERAHDAKSGVEILKKDAFHLALLDKNMPNILGDMDEDAGEKMYEYIHENYSYTTCIILTNVPTVESVKTTIREGLFDYFDKKSLSAGKLSHVVEHALQARKVKVQAWNGFPEEVDPLDFYSQEGVVERTISWKSVDGGVVQLPSGKWKADIDSRIRASAIRSGQRVRATYVKDGRVHVEPIEKYY